MLGLVGCVRDFGPYFKTVGKISVCFKSDQWQDYIWILKILLWLHCMESLMEETRSSCRKISYKAILDVWSRPNSGSGRVTAVEGWKMNGFENC